MTFPQKLRSLREAAGLSMAQLADKATLSRAMIHALETAKRKPSLETARQICKALNISLSHFDK